MQNNRRYIKNNFRPFIKNRVNNFQNQTKNTNMNKYRNTRSNNRQRFQKRNFYNIRRTFANNINRSNRRFNNMDNNRQIKQLVKYVKNSSLGGGPLKSLNTNINKSVNDPNNKSTKEIRYDKLYSALQMYLMGKYYSFYKTTNMIVRFPIYTTYTFIVEPNTEVASFIWYPYFYPYLVNATVRVTDENRKVDCASNFLVRLGTTITAFESTLATIRGNHRLIAATMKVANITTNSAKGGSYTLYRLCRSETAPIFYNRGLGIGDEVPIAGIREMIGFPYNNEPNKYLYNANQVGLGNEYGVIEGNTVFQGYDEYMGQRDTESTSLYVASAGGATGRIGADFNPQGVNVKFMGWIDPTSTAQTYKVECIQIFEVTPLSADSLSTLAYKGDRNVNSNVISQAKNKFNFEVANP